MLWSKKHGFIFVKTKKTAGTSIEVLLQEYCVPAELLKRSQHKTAEIVTSEGIVGFRGRYRPLFCKFYNHMTLGEIQNRLGESELSRCLIVTSIRNPYDAAISFFHQKYCRPSEAARIYANTPDRLRKKFLKSVEATPDQTAYSDIDGVNRVDIAVRFECFEMGLLTLSKTLGLSSLTSRIGRGDLPKLKQRSNALKNLPRNAYFSDEALRLVNKKYARWFFQGDYTRRDHFADLD